MYNMFFGRRRKFQLNNAETTYKVHYLGNVMTSLIKGGYHHGQLLKTNDLNESIKSDNYEKEKTVNEEDNSLNEDEYNENNNEMTTQENEEDENDNEINFKKLQQESTNKRFNNIVCNVDKPVKILWDNHLKHNGHAGLKMKLTITQGGLRVDTKDHGLTEYYGHRIHYIQSHPFHPKLFIWVYQHVGKNLKTEIRCHAALCHTTRDSRSIESILNERLQCTFLEYKREKRRMQNSRLCNIKNGLLAGQFGTRKRSLRCTKNYKPPVQHGMSSAPKLDDVIEEEEEEEEDNNEREIDIKFEELNETNCLQQIQHLFLNNEKEEIQQITNNDFDHISCSSSSSSETNSNLSSPLFNQNKQIIINESSISSSSSSSTNSSDLINYSNQTYLELDSPTDDDLKEIILVESNQCSRNNKLIIEKLNDNDNEKFTEVSYDFLADLSKLNRAKSFINKKNDTSNNNTNKNFNNPFRRTNISKSFSTFTTRLKQQKQQKTSELKVEIIHNNNNHSKVDSNVKNMVIRPENCLIKNLSDSTSSPMSSPDLSTSSSSSFNSSKNNQLIKIN